MKTYLAHEEQERLLRKYGLRYDGQLGWESFPGLALVEVAVTLLQRIETLENEVADIRRGKSADLTGYESARLAEKLLNPKKDQGFMAGAAGKD